jgi:putative alpha-1,2-mannosidase
MSYAASPGYFDITLADGIHGESTVTAHTALHRFTFPSNTSFYGNATKPVITIDIADLAKKSVKDAAVSIDPQTGRISGNGTFMPSFGRGQYTLHFCADFQSAGVRNVVGIWEKDQPLSELTEHSIRYHRGGGGFAVFDVPTGANQVVVRVGLSFMSASQACHNAESEIPDFGFERVKRSAEEAWRKKLQVIKINPKGVDADLQTIFWSGIYRTMISPQDYTGENPLWNSSEPYFDSFYCIWDSFRSQHPFLTLADPLEQTRMVRGLIDIFKHEGKLPDCRMSLCKGYTQGGSNADIVLADALIKNLTTGIDWELGYEAVVSDAEEEPKSWDDSGRGGLESWTMLGYIPIRDNDTLGSGLKTRSISRTVEYAYDDFCIAEMAGKLGRRDDQAKYYQRADNWRNLFNENQASLINGTDTGFVGFLQPK